MGYTPVITPEQKVQIDTLREQGVTLKGIAIAVGLKLGTARSYIYREDNLNKTHNKKGFIFHGNNITQQTLEETFVRRKLVERLFTALSPGMEVKYKQKIDLRQQNKYVQENTAKIIQVTQHNIIVQDNKGISRTISDYDLISKNILLKVC